MRKSDEVDRDMTRIAIYDTTLRDGSQGEGVNFSLQDKLLITGRLDVLGVDYIEGGYPLSNPKDAAYFREVGDLDLTHAKVTAFGMTRRRDCAPEDDTGMQALVAAKTPAVTIVGKSWDLHVREVLGVSLDENLRMIADSVGFCGSHVP
jgi:2-isopropylmalate synthase